MILININIQTPEFQISMLIREFLNGWDRDKIMKNILHIEIYLSANIKYVPT